jgi:hypothetical protein
MKRTEMMNRQDFENGLVCTGDFVIDHLNHETRQIESIECADDFCSVLMTDGGVMGLEEISFDDIRLEDELDP